MINNDTNAPAPSTYTRENYKATLAAAYDPDNCEQCEACQSVCWECGEDALYQQGMEPDAFGFWA